MSDVRVNLSKASFTLGGPDWRPPDASWRAAKPSERLRYWRELGRLAAEAKRAELARGVGVDGRRLRATKRPRPDHADGPPLTPHGEASRFRKWLRFAVGRDGATLFWSHGWAAVVGAHAFPRRKPGGRPARPRRDVVGLTESSRRSILRRAMTWWGRTRHDHNTGEG